MGIRCLIFLGTSDHGNFFFRAPSGASILLNPLWEMPIKSNQRDLMLHGLIKENNISWYSAEGKVLTFRCSTILRANHYFLNQSGGSAECRLQQDCLTRVQEGKMK